MKKKKKWNTFKTFLQEPWTRHQDFLLRWSLNNDAMQEDSRCFAQNETFSFVCFLFVRTKEHELHKKWKEEGNLQQKGFNFCNEKTSDSCGTPKPKLLCKPNSYQWQHTRANVLSDADINFWRAKSHTFSTKNKSKIEPKVFRCFFENRAVLCWKMLRMKGEKTQLFTFRLEVCLQENNFLYCFNKNCFN